jgi:hypothetical protein
MDINSFEKLLSSDGQQLLARLRDTDLCEENVLRHITELRKSHPRELVDAAIETTLLRQRAAAKFSKADEMYFTREALEQASSEQVSSYRAERYSSYSKIADLGCGIGGDAIPLARNCRVLAVDKDPLRLAMAKKNAEAYGVADRIEFLEADITELDIRDVDAIFFDPARRSEGRRVLSVNDYSPPLGIMEKWLPDVPSIGVKISPAMKYEEITWDCEIEFISFKGELKEAVLWFGPMKTTSRRATLLPSRATLHRHSEPLHRHSEPLHRHSEPVEEGSASKSIPLSKPLAYLFEPDPAVIRSHLVETLAESIGASKLDEDIAYLSSDDGAETPFARRYVIQETMPFNVKKLNERLRSLDIGRVIIKKRGSPIEPHELQKKLKLSGSKEIVVVLTHLAGRPSILLCSESLPSEERGK